MSWEETKEMMIKRRMCREDSIWRPKRRCMDSIKNDLTEKGLSGEEAQDRAAWRRLIQNIDPHIKGGGGGERGEMLMMIWIDFHLIHMIWRVVGRMKSRHFFLFQMCSGVINTQTNFCQRTPLTISTFQLKCFNLQHLLQNAAAIPHSMSICPHAHAWMHTFVSVAEYVK